MADQLPEVPMSITTRALALGALALIVATPLVYFAAQILGAWSK